MRNLGAAIGIVVVCLLLAVGACSAQVKNVLQAGENLIAQKKYEEAVKTYEQELAAVKGKADRELLQKAIADVLFSKMQDYARAATEYQKLLDLYPKSKEGDFYYYRLGQSFEQQAQWTRAAEAYQNVPIKYRKSQHETASLDGVERCFKKVFKDYIAVIDGEPITRMEFEDELNNIPPFYRSQYETEEGKERFLDQLIDRRLLVRETERRNLASDPDVLKKLTDAKQRIMVSSLMDQETKKVMVSDQEIQKYYDEHKKDEFRIPEQRKARQIVVKTEEEAKDVLKQLGNKVLFDTLAAQKSTDTYSAKKGGDMGFVSRGSREMAIDRTLFGLGPGDVTDPIRVKEGWAVYKVEERLDAEGKEPTKFQLRELVVKTEGEARTLADTLKKGGDFQAMATEKSIAKSKKKGGDLGTLSETQIKDPALQRALFGMKAGETVGPVKVNAGYAILRLEEMKPASFRPFDEVTDRIKNSLTRKSQQERYTQFMEELKTSAKIEKHLKSPEEEKKMGEGESGGEGGDEWKLEIDKETTTPTKPQPKK
jgi:peptidyl-prolyl cis-trans isomerase C